MMTPSWFHSCTSSDIITDDLHEILLYMFNSHTLHAFLCTREQTAQQKMETQKKAVSETFMSHVN